MTIPVSTVAGYIVQNSADISNLKLQKLLYYVQGWHLGLKGTPIFREELQAWVHGPVVPEMFQQYRIYGWNPIEKPIARISIPASEAGHIKRVLDIYGKYAANQLERLSHSEPPWRAARKGLPDNIPSQAVITHESMRAFFASRAKA